MFDSEWNKCNPEWLPCIFEKGAIQLYNNKKGCGTGLIILGREEYLRRIVAVGGRGLDDYLQEWVDLGELGPIDSRIAKLEV